MRTKTYSRRERQDEDALPGYPAYEDEEDIYSNAREEEEIDPETKKKKPSVYDEAEDDLDVPGSELDDDMEDVGSEDEENNYYSLSDNDDLEDVI
jgi:hypothetical protein